MMVIRLVVLALLLYIAWVLLRGLKGKKKPEVRDRSEGGAGADANVQDTLIEDPVCHRLVPKHQAIRLRKDGQTYYFCSDECCDTFTETPRGKA
jgi:YHS domain-containing protein